MTKSMPTLPKGQPASLRRLEQLTHTSFGGSAQNARVYIVLDYSGSMDEGRKMQQAKNGARSAEGVDHWEPRTDEEWAVVVNGAMTMTEAANLLMMGDRARDQDTWMQMAQGLVDAGRLALEAAEARDAEAVFALGEEVYNACDRCHNLYWVGDRGARP